jgi:hypothetical protein
MGCGLRRRDGFEVILEEGAERTGDDDEFDLA